MNHFGYYYFPTYPYSPQVPMYYDTNRQLPQGGLLERRLNALERKFERLEGEMDRLQKENNRQNGEFTRITKELTRMNNEIIRLNKNDERNTRQHNRFNQRLRTIEGRLNIPYQQSSDD